MVVFYSRQDFLGFGRASARGDVESLLLLKLVAGRSVGGMQGMGCASVAGCGVMMPQGKVCVGPVVGGFEV